MKQYVFDTHLLIWGIREEAESGQEAMIPRTRAFFEHCKDEGIQILVPSVVVGELLTAIPSQHHPTVVNLLRTAFVLPPYDAASAAVFARLWQQRKDSGDVGKIRSELRASRQELKADCMIVATALVQNATAIFSHDLKLKAFADGEIPVHEVPRLPVQESFELADG